MSDLNTTIGFKASSELVAKADAAAKAEGLSRADIARRALLRDLAGMFGGTPTQPRHENAA